MRPPVVQAFLMALGLAVTLTLPAFAQAIDWIGYGNPRYGYAIELPMGMFEIEAEAENGDGLTLVEIGGRGQIDVFGATNLQGLTPTEYADVLSGTERIREVTYRTGGNSWFVLSGYFDREGEDSTDLIFYTKYMFNADRSALAAFEISYPAGDKALYDPIVTRLEKSMRAPD